MNDQLKRNALRGFAGVFFLCWCLPCYLLAQEDTFDLKKPEELNTVEAVKPLPLSANMQVVAESASDKTGSPSDKKDTDLPSKKKEGKDTPDLITVNFENVDIRDVIRILADKAQLNMIVGPEVAAMVNLQLTNVSWDKALDVILKTYNLTYKKDGDLIRIMTLEQLQQEDEKVPLTTKIIRLNFARASEVAKNFSNMLSSRGKIDVNERTNAIIITDIPDNIRKIEPTANELDTRTPQVTIEALMADVTITDDDRLGITWTLEQEAGLAAAPEKAISQTLPVTGAIGSIVFGTTILTDKDLHATIAFLKSQSRVNILAHPQITTLDNSAAKIDLTEEIPYKQQTVTTDNPTGITSTSFKQAGISLNVTPHITTKDNFIYLIIDVKQSFNSRFTDDGQPVIDGRSASTNLLVRNKETAVIGGLRQKNDTLSVDKMPLLGDIPLLGSIFRRRVGALRDTDLMIFITPTIVEDFILPLKQKERLNLLDEEQKDWSKKFNPSSQKSKQKTPDYNLQTPLNAEGGRFYLRPPLLNGGVK